MRGERGPGGAYVVGQLAADGFGGFRRDPPGRFPAQAVERLDEHLRVAHGGQGTSGVAQIGVLAHEGFLAQPGAGQTQQGTEFFEVFAGGVDRVVTAVGQHG